ncbi:MAG: hypothetical protein HRT35_32560 [Algicola sp.]|nr:hypothetical protein [Algicola sp.]
MIAISQFVKEHVKTTLLILTILVGVASYAVFSAKSTYPLSYLFRINTQFDICKTGLHYRRDVLDNIQNLLNEQGGIAKQYFSVKGLSAGGLTYLLLINYETDALMVTYDATYKLKTKSLSRKEGVKRIADLVGDNFGQTQDYNGEFSYHGSCHFMRLYDGGTQHEIKLINPPYSHQDIIEIGILARAKAMINAQYGPNDAVSIPQVADELTAAELEALDDLTGEDLFHELKYL